MRLEVFIHEGLAEIGAEELHIPLGLASHTARDDGALNQVAFDTLLTA
jgi:hypothetical protein